MALGHRRPVEALGVSTGGPAGGTVDACAERGIVMYGGGQFELGPGRTQIQNLASLLYPEAPNDVAPVGFHAPEPAAGLEPSPLAPPVGFGEVAAPATRA